MAMFSLAVDETSRKEHEYDNWISALIEASARLDLSTTAGAQLLDLCLKGDVHSEQVLELLQRYGADLQGRSQALPRRIIVSLVSAEPLVGSALTFAPLTPVPWAR